jgi:hypothetical protein
MREMGEVVYHRQRLKAAVAWMTAKPGRFARLTAERFRLFWFPKLGPGVASYPFWVVTLLGWIGVIWAYRSNRFAASLFGSMLGVYPLVYYLVQHVLRYRYPILWVSSLMSAYALAAAWDRIRRPLRVK